VPPAEFRRGVPHDGEEEELAIEIRLDAQTRILILDFVTDIS
jgi:hypothetical protein